MATDFREFCKAEELEEETIRKLEDLKITSIRKLKALREDAVDRLALPEDQHYLLLDVVSDLRKDSGQGGSNTFVEGQAPQKMKPTGQIRYGDKILRLVLFGKTGNGKSSTGNTILGRHAFEEFFGQGSGTEVCRIQAETYEGRHISVVDTPGVCDTSRKPEHILFEVSKCLIFSAPGPHALLFVVNAKARFTEEEAEAYTILKDTFAKHLNKYLVVIFTHCEALGNSKEKLKEVIQKAGDKVDKAKEEGRNMPDIRKVLKDASDRFVIISNVADKATKSRQVLELLNMIETMMSQNPKEYFEDESTKKATEDRQRLLDDIMCTNPDISQDKAIEMLEERLEAERKAALEQLRKQQRREDERSDQKAIGTALLAGVAGIALGAATGGIGTMALVGASYAASGGAASKWSDGKCAVM